MIGSLLLFLGSAGYLTYRAASSSNAQRNLNTHMISTGINFKRQLDLEVMSVGSTPENRKEFVRLLRNADLSRTTYRNLHEEKRKYLLEEYAKFDAYSSVCRGIKCFGDMIKREDSNYAVWIIAQSEGWTYEKGIAHGLPDYCYGYNAFNDSYVKKMSRRI